MSLWDTILKDAGTNQAQQGAGAEGAPSSSVNQRAPNKQVLILGPYYAGKRTLAARLRESSGDKRSGGGNNNKDDDDYSPGKQVASSGAVSRSGGGIDHSFVDVRSEDGHVLATVELFVLDSPGVIPVVLPTAASCQNAMVIFAVDLSTPDTSLDSFDHWVSVLNAHVTKVAEEAGPGGYEELRGLRIKEWGVNSTMFLPSRQRAYDNLKDRSDGGANGMPSNTVVLDPTAVCLLPSVVVGAKLDQYEKYCRGKSDPSHSEIGTLAYGIEVMRKRALDMRSGFTSLSLLSSSPSANSALKGLWYWTLVECLKIPNVSLPEPAAATGGSAWNTDGTMNNNSLGENVLGAGRTRALSQIGDDKKPTIDSSGAAAAVPTVGDTIWNYCEPLICYEVEDSSVFVPHGADLYELLSGFVRTSDGVQAWPSFFPPATFKRPKISSHTETLNNLKEKLTSDDNGQGDLWDL